MFPVVGRPGGEGPGLRGRQAGEADAVMILRSLLPARPLAPSLFGGVTHRDVGVEGRVDTDATDRRLYNKAPFCPQLPQPMSDNFRECCCVSSSADENTTAGFMTVELRWQSKVWTRLFLPYLDDFQPCRYTPKTSYI